MAGLSKKREGKGKLNRAEWAVIALTAVLLALMAGWALGAGSARRTLRQAEPDAATALATSAPDPTASVSPSPSVDPGDSPAPETAEPGFPLDLNTATAEELMALPGIGEKRAADIVDWREANGPFRHVEDLIQVPGIGEGLLEGLMDYITVGGT